MTSILSLQNMSGFRAKYLEIFENSGNQLVDRILGEINKMKFDVIYLAEQPILTQPNGLAKQQLDLLNNFIKLGESRYASVAIYNLSGYKILDTIREDPNRSISYTNISTSSIPNRVFFNSTIDRISNYQNGFHITAPLYNNQDLLTGLVDVRVSDTFIYNIVNNTLFSLNKEGNIYKFSIDLIHDNGALIFSTRSNIFESHDSGILMNNFSLSDKSSFDGNFSRGKSTLISIPIPITLANLQTNGNWTMLLNSQNISSIEEFNKTVGDFLIASSVILVSAILVTVILVNKITLPITQLKNVALELSRNKFEKEIMVEGLSEVKDLSISLEVMRRNVENSKKNLIRKVKERTRDLEKANEHLIAKETEVNMINEELLKSNKAKEEFLSMVSHELKTPITPMKLYIEMMLKGNRADELNVFQKKALGIVHKNILKLETIINDIFTVYRMELDTFKISKKITNVTELIDSNMSALSPLMRDKNIQFSSSVRTNKKVLCDPVRISQVFFNLVNNAVDHVPQEGGRIVIKAEDENQGQTNIPATLGTDNINENGKVIFTVEDNGIGIAGSNMDSLFKKFYQIDTGLSRKYGGTGLGLAICKGIIESHGGTIWIDPFYKNGASFKFTLISA
ncbi:MAG TPA: HAMP domain-containing sensor histidine kinase [Candidatus Nitrosocosmicus sp.]|nr:HAMP domain-containing sensor histidine kinase [Candidatus Nitrosocosmicus sp.]